MKKSLLGLTFASLMFSAGSAVAADGDAANLLI